MMEDIRHGVTGRGGPAEEYCVLTVGLTEAARSTLTPERNNRTEDNEQWRQFEGMERRMAGIERLPPGEYGLNIARRRPRHSAMAHGIDVAAIVKGVQPIAFENAVWAYTLGTALALKKGAKSAAEAS